MSSQIRGYGLIDLNRGVIPTFEGWDTNPTDGANITDGSLLTKCETGNKVLGEAYQYAYIIFDLGKESYIETGGRINMAASAGTPRVYLEVYYSGGWHRMQGYVQNGTSNAPTSYTGIAEQIRLALTSDAVSTITPDIHMWNCWKIL